MRRFLIASVLCGAAFAMHGAVQAATRGHVLLGGNGTQISLVGENETNVSNGYAGYVGGIGFSYIPNPNFVIELDSFWALRKFGFGNTFGSFSTIQIPLTAQYHFWQYHVGGGAYSALWNFQGSMKENGVTKAVAAKDAGISENEFGFVVMAGLTHRVWGLPLRIDARRFQSLSNVSAKSGFKGSLVEWQILLGYEVNTDALLQSLFGIKPSPVTTNPAKSGTKSAPPAKGAAAKGDSKDTGGEP